MGARNANLWSRLASSMTSLSHMRAPAVRWGVLAALAGLWLGAGYLGWMAEKGAGAGPLDIIYRTLGALSVQDSYADLGERNDLLAVARFAGVAIPVIGLLFAFSGQLGQSLAQLFYLGAARHVVIAGAGPDAIALALDCATAKDVVTLIGQNLPDETAWALRTKGVILVEGDASLPTTLAQARVRFASHVVALSPDDSQNLRIEAAVRTVAAGRKPGKRPLMSHIAMRSPILLQEAREMRDLETKAANAAAQAVKGRKIKKPRRPGIEARPFSLEELAARSLFRAEASTILNMAATLSHKRPHIVIFGLDPTGEAVALRMLVSLWSAQLGEPRVTVVSPNPAETERGFDARYPQARAHDIWRADIAFLGFDWKLASADESLIRYIEEERGAPSAFVVSTGSDSDNIAISLALLRACNAGDPDPTWPAPIFLKEETRSEFAKIYASGDSTPGVLDAYLLAFGEVENVATRANIIESRLDVGAAIAHSFWDSGMMETGVFEDSKLEALRKRWEEIGETYRAANRAMADSAIVKVWDAGWRPAHRGEFDRAERTPAIAADLMPILARREHDRWNAERLLSGWRPGPKRNNKLRIHPSIIPFDALSESEIAKDVRQVEAAIAIVRAMNPQGFVAR
jgi:hypothetical protein